MPVRMKEHWKTLCAQAAQEQDPNRLIELVEQINSLLGDNASGDAAKGIPTTTLRDADAA